MDTTISTERIMGDQQGTYYGELVRGTRWRYEDGRKVRHLESVALSPDNWWDWVAQQCRKGTVTWLFAFDLLRQLRCTGLLELLSSRVWRLTSQDRDDSTGNQSQWNGFAVLADPPVILICRAPRNRGVLKLVDLRNYGVSNRTDIGPESDWIMYAEMWVCNVVQWIRDNRLGEMQCTAGAQSLHSFRRRFLDEPISCHDNNAAATIESDSFYGGRCEVSRIGEVRGPIYHLDCNSLYPAACQGLDLPIELLAVKEPHEWTDPLSLPPGTGMIAEVRIKTDLPIYPLRRAGLVIYPVGQFTTVLAGPELNDACTYGHVMRFGRSCLYRCEPILSDYMHWLYCERIKSRQRTDTATECMIKRMLVGLPGKFIQQDRQWVADSTRRATQPWQLWREVDVEKREIHQYRAFGWHVQREEVSGPAKNAMPAIGAWITSAARVLMRDFFDVIPSGHMYYTDTDSLWVDQIGYDALLAEDVIHETRLGALKLVGTHQHVEFRGIKHYVADGRVVRAGIGGTACATDVTARHNSATRSVHEDLLLGQSPQPVDYGSQENQWPVYRHGVVGEGGWVKPWKV